MTSPLFSRGASAIALASASVVALLSCGGGSHASGPSVSYQKDIRVMLETSCTSCHYTGGIAPFPLDNWPAVQAAASGVHNVVQDGTMPPWLADSSCHAMRDSPALSDEQKKLFADWKAAGFPEGNASDYHPAPVHKVDIGPASIVWPMPTAYATPRNVNDNYRCFLLQGTFDKDTYITAVNIAPGQAETVHHVQIHTIPASAMSQAAQMDGSDGSPGWDCSGSTAITGDYNLFSWRPGTQTAVFEPGDAVLVDAGTAVVMQVHYNTQNLKPGEAVPPDLSTVSFWTLPDGALPDRIIRRYGLFGLFLSIPAGNPNFPVVSRYSMSNVSTVGDNNTFLAGELVGETPHMHHLGTKLSVTKTDAQGAKTCMVDVPHWDFEWQMDYFYAPGTGVPFTANDSITIECDYDNSAAHQPSLNGVTLAPAATTFGEGSYNEMCLSYAWLRYDRDAYLTAVGKK
jgi:hypothetical protein